MQLAGLYDNLSDSAIDRLYAEQTAIVTRTRGAEKVAAAQKQSDIAVEILHRLTSVTGFVRGAFGGSSFPQFDAIQRKTPGGFVQSEASQSAIKERAAEVASTLKFGVGGLVVGGVAVFLLAAWLKGKR